MRKNFARQCGETGTLKTDRFVSAPARFFFSVHRRHPGAALIAVAVAVIGSFLIADRLTAAPGTPGALSQDAAGTMQSRQSTKIIGDSAKADGSKRLKTAQSPFGGSFLGDRGNFWSKGVKKPQVRSFQKYDARPRKNVIRVKPGQRRIGPERNRKNIRSLGASAQTYRTMCVRTCDGYYWPISFATTKGRLKKDSRSCQASCGSAKVSLYYYSNPGAEIEDMKNLRGQAYKRLANAFRYRQEIVPTCRCKPLPWSEAAMAMYEKRAIAAQKSARKYTRRKSKRSRRARNRGKRSRRVR